MNFPKTATLIAIGFGMAGFASVSEGGPKGLAKAAMKNQAASNQQLVQAIHALQSVKITLEKADHDYGGHRAKAVKEIAQAEHQIAKALHAHQKKLGIQNNNVAKGGKAMREPQPLSDAQLREMIPVLGNTMVVLGNANHDYGGHREKAMMDLQAAIKQLETALKFSKVHDQKKKKITN